MLFYRNFSCIEVILSNLNWFFQAANVGFGRVFALVSDSFVI